MSGNPRAALEEIANVAANNRLTIHISQTFPIAQTADARIHSSPDESSGLRIRIARELNLQSDRPIPLGTETPRRTPRVVAVMPLQQDAKSYFEYKADKRKKKMRRPVFAPK
jgi:hypothetical protein